MLTVLHADSAARTCTRARMQEEQAKRRQAERDFLELMQSIEDGGSAGAGGAGLLASQRLSAMQVRESMEGWGRSVRSLTSDQGYNWGRRRRPAGITAPVCHAGA